MKRAYFQLDEEKSQSVGWTFKITRIMKLTLILICLSVSAVFASVSEAQNSVLTLQVADEPMAEVLEKIERQTNYHFFYNSKLVDVSRPVTLHIEEKEITVALEQLFRNTDIVYKVVGNDVILSPAEAGRNQQGNKKIKGTITDSYGEPVIGANVVEKGSANGTITDLDGAFTLEVGAGAVLVVSYIGFNTQHIAVGDQSRLSIRMKEDTRALDEVVVVGYGVQKKKLVTGATVHVGGEDVMKMNSTSVFGALQSQTPGLDITKISGQPGSGFKVSIRGLGTTGNATPLYIVDGVVVGSIDNINTADIEAVDVLKDAASAAIYGSRAANGVILITTRQGKKGKISLQYDGYYALQTTCRMPQLLDAQQYALIMSEAAANSGQQDFKYAELVPDWDKIQSGQWHGTNWLKEITNNYAPMQNHSLNLAGGTDQSTYSMGLSYMDQEGIIGKPANPYYQRYTFRMNAEFVVAKAADFDVLKIGENLTYSYTNNRSELNQGTQNNSIRSALATNPFLPMYEESGDYHYCLPWFEPHANPYALIDYTEKGYEKNTQSMIGRVYLKLQPVKGLVWQTSFGIHTSARYDRSYVPVFRIGSDPAHDQTIDFVGQAHTNSFRWIFDNTVNYKKKAGGHLFDGLVGVSAEKSGIGQSISGTNQGSTFDSFKYAYLGNVPVISPSLTTLTGAPLTDNRLLSFFGRVNYDYKETYMASVVFRADGSSNFSPGNRWGYFPSVSAGWVISNESFMQKTAPWLDFLKLRASWGQNGNSDISPFQYLSTIHTSDALAVYFPGVDKTQLTQGAYPDIAANPDIKWETSEQLNIGLDSRFLGGRLNVTFDWYDKRTKDWLVKAPILGSIGTGAPFINGGDVKNTGVELGLGWYDSAGDFTYNITGNLSYNQNEVTRIANSEGIIHGATGILGNGTPEFYRAEVGYPIGYFWALKTDGVFQNQAEIDNYVNTAGEKIMPDAKPGDLKFVNQDDNNTIDEKDRVMIGSPHPTFKFGVSVNMEYKGFDFSMVTNGALGGHLFKSYRNINQRPLDNYTTDILGRWRGEGTSVSIPRVTLGNHINDAYISDRYIEKGDYWRCSNLTFGYDFKKLFTLVPLQQLRLYVSVQNLFVVTSYSGMDPEVGQGRESWASGIDIGYYPNPRSYMLGASIKF